MKKVLLSIVTLIALSFGASAQNVNIPDANFKAYLVGNSAINTNSDTEIQVSEATAFTGTISFNNNNSSISDLTGIEAFTALTFLYCSNNSLTTLDVSNNTNLTLLDCSSNSLTTLDVSNNTALTNLNFINNSLTTLDVSNNTDLTILFCSSNSLTTLDVSNNTALTNLGCGNNSLTTLDVSNNTALTNLGCGNNSLTTLDVSNNTALTNLGCNDNSLTTLDVTNNTTLSFLTSFNNLLTTLDVSNNTALTQFRCDNNSLTVLDLANGNNTNLIFFMAGTNPNLTCIQVDDVSYSTTNWTNIDPGASFSLDCGYISLVNSITVQGQAGASTITTPGGTLQMEADVLPVNADDDTYIWSVANGTGSATISTSGLLTAVADGTVTVTATANDNSGTTGTEEITISNQVNLVTSITVQGQAGASTITTPGGTLQMEADVLPVIADDDTYIWSVANGTGTATISAGGLLTAVADGMVTVTATANDNSGTTGTEEITISNQVNLVTSITVQGQAGASTITTPGGTLQMEADVLPVNADDDTYIWSVANGTGSATISTSGLLTAVADGMVTVTATANDNSGTTGTEEITISNQVNLVTSITVQGQAGASTITTPGGTLQMEADVLPVNADDDTYIWSVANGTGSATISTSGLLTAVADGMVTVTATANDASGTTASTVITISNQSIVLDIKPTVHLLSIYPNPAKRQITIHSNEKIETVTIFDFTGKTLKTIVSSRNTIDVSDLINGIYFLQIQTNKDLTSKRLVIE